MIIVCRREKENSYLIPIPNSDMGLFGRKKYNDEDSDVWINKGISLAQLERYEESIACFDEAIRLNPEESMVWYVKGRPLKKLGRDEEAEECFAKAKELDES